LKSQTWRIDNVTDELEQRAEAAGEEQPAAEAESEIERVVPDAEAVVEAELPSGEEGELAALRDELESAKCREAEYLEGWQRARAELSNARKRFQREQERAYENAKADLLVRLLPIVDDFERAFLELPDDEPPTNWVEGIQLILHKLRALLEQEGVAPIEAAGQEFDPFLHQALTHEPSTEVAEGHIIAEVQKGYRLADRVLRPTVVRVSAGAPAEAGPEDQDRLEEEPAGN
jgi:molecular chaperone GrpE